MYRYSQKKASVLAFVNVPEYNRNAKHIEK